MSKEIVVNRLSLTLEHGEGLTGIYPRCIDITVKTNWNNRVATFWSPTRGIVESQYLARADLPAIADACAKYYVELAIPIIEEPADVSPLPGFKNEVREKRGRCNDPKCNDDDCPGASMSPLNRPSPP